MEFGKSVLTVEKVKNQELIFITPKGKRIKAFEEVRKPQNKKSCPIFCGMLRSLSKWKQQLRTEWEKIMRL